MICPKCSTENPGHARFCGTCGHSLAPQAGPAATSGAAFQSTVELWERAAGTGLVCCNKSGSAEVLLICADCENFDSLKETI